MAAMNSTEGCMTLPESSAANSCLAMESNTSKSTKTAKSGLLTSTRECSETTAGDMATTTLGPRVCRALTAKAGSFGISNLHQEQISSLTAMPSTSQKMGCGPTTTLVFLLCAWTTTGMLRRGIPRQVVHENLPSTENKYYFTVATARKKRTANYFALKTAPQSSPEESA